MKKFYNTNPEYGGEGPYTAESKEAVADRMSDRIATWAAKSLGPYAGYEGALKVLKGVVRNHFIDGLKEHPRKISEEG
jgi:hypothetical protein